MVMPQQVQRAVNNQQAECIAETAAASITLRRHIIVGDDDIAKIVDGSVYRSRQGHGREGQYIGSGVNLPMLAIVCAQGIGIGDDDA